MSIDLSKSKYCKGIQCPKILWMDEYKPEEASNILPESVMANGNMVGDLARQYFGEYELVEFNYNKSVMAGKTSELMNSGTANIAEAAFYTDGLYCAVDILHRVGDAYDIIEVKSSTHATDTISEAVLLYKSNAGILFHQVCTPGTLSRRSGA